MCPRRLSARSIRTSLQTFGNGWTTSARRGNDLLAISHNANLSDGRMYPTEVDINGRPIDRAYAEDRMRNEPLIEIKQIKGRRRPIRCFRPMTSSPTSRSCRSCSATRQAASPISLAAMHARP